ncbi:hypothetical protein LJR030_004996 [Rhizobium sp. LjRoot30]|uniref:hypothetical protein n=1 Tax=Rhizobium sp. LjRoot30 TaxID=3342320 RepID=UPI003ECC2A71
MAAILFFARREAAKPRAVYIHVTDITEQARPASDNIAELAHSMTFSGFDQAPTR